MGIMLIFHSALSSTATTTVRIGKCVIKKGTVNNCFTFVFFIFKRLYL